MRKPRIVIAVLLLVAAPAILIAWTCHLANSEQPYDALKTQLASLEMKIEVYELDTGELPKSLRHLISNNGVRMWKGPYAKESDIHNSRGGDNEYQVISAKSFKISALGRNGIKVERTHEP